METSLEKHLDKKRKITDTDGDIKYEGSDIYLNFGIEIECVFELIDTFGVYIWFIDVFLKLNKATNRKNSLVRINSAPSHVFNKLIDELIDITDLLKAGSPDFDNLFKREGDNCKEAYDTLYIYKNGAQDYRKVFLTFLKIIIFNSKDNVLDINPKPEIDEAVLLGDPEIGNYTPVIIEKHYDTMKNFFGNLTILINSIIFHGIRYIRELGNKENDKIIKDIFIKFFKNFVIGPGYTNDVFKKRFSDYITKASKIKIYDGISLCSDDFYRLSEHQRRDIHLLLIEDASVVCDDELIYEKIVSGESYVYEFLLNKCEFITQVFNNTSEIERLHNFFTNEQINMRLFNCKNTSNHVHISFNKNKELIKPDLYNILAIVCVCLYFQEEIYKLFLITRSNNKHCEKLMIENTMTDYNTYDIPSDYYTDNAVYNKVLIKILHHFYNNPSILHTGFNDYRYYWLNLLNLINMNEYDIKDWKKPPTIEFRLKHGSTDATELKNFCILYENIIIYAIKLSSEIPSTNKGNILLFKESILQILRRDSTIFTREILKNIDRYFTDHFSEYVKGLKQLNLLIQQRSLTTPQDIKTSSPVAHTPNVIKKGGRHSILELLRKIIDTTTRTNDKFVTRTKTRNTSSAKKLINKKIKELKDEPIFKLNSFGKQFISYGLDEYFIKTLYDNIDKINNDKDFYDFLKKNNIFIN